jgi:hypothetical protein
MMFETIVQRAREGWRRLPPVVRRRGRRSAALGAVLLAASTASVLATANTPPQIVTLVQSAPAISAGEAVIVAGTFTDPDATDAHTIVFYWDDGVSYPQRVEKLQLPPGQLAFQLSHVYPTPVRQANISVTVVDRLRPGDPNDNHAGEGRDNKQLALEVKTANVAPTFVDSSIVVDVRPFRTGFVTIHGDWKDPDSESGTVTLMPGDGHQSGSNTYCTSDGHHFQCLYRYRVVGPPKEYTLRLIVKDDHGAVGTFESTVKVP